MSEHLTPLDATFLELEQADESAHMHIGGVLVFDPLPGGGTPSHEDMCQQLASRLGQLPRYGQRLSQPHTGGLSWPTWEEDPAFDIGRHVARAALPAPGGDEELAQWASNFFSQRLDRHRPLWEMAIVEGLADGRWALVHKTHHCMVDGVGSVDVGYLLLDTTPDAAPAARPPPPRTAPTHPPPWMLSAPRPPPTRPPRARWRLWRTHGRGCCRLKRSSTPPRWAPTACCTRARRCTARKRRSASSCTRSCERRRARASTGRSARDAGSRSCASRWRT